MGELSVAGRRLGSLRHGMGGAPGPEFWGPVALYDEVRNAIIEAGQKYGLRLVGARAYGTAAVDSGWLPCLYAGEAMHPYREWLPAASHEGMASLGAASFRTRSRIISSHPGIWTTAGQFVSITISLDAKRWKESRIASISGRCRWSSIRMTPQRCSAVRWGRPQRQGNGNAQRALCGLSL
ncbi:hypothetical protein [Novosphingobium sp. PY1]|uniref:hypothetical protein n=1 Tax=Novosphingobium sp. PY1 TaxID=1882221 RepID=UPI001A8DA91F|nr:hypothetical protein [Novosphingobium sp. PY1]